MFTMHVGIKVGLVFSLNEQRIRASEIVATRYPQVGNGIEFIELTPEDRLKLSEYIATCEEQMS